MNWNTKLAYTITPKSGPMRSMETLLDANNAIIRDLPAGYLKRDHWRVAGWLLVRAADGEDVEILDVTERLLEAIEREGWMTRPRLASQRREEGAVNGANPPDS